MSIFRAFAGTFPALILAAVGTVICAGAQAQQFMDTGSSQVTVDLGVIDDSGYGAGLGSPAYGGRRLLMPGPVMPVSRLLVAPPKGSAPPMKKPMKEPPQAKAAPPPMPKFAPPPVAKMAVVAPPPPPVAKTAVVAPPPPPPKPAPEVVKKKAPKPTAMAVKKPAAAPPPPPPPPETKTVKLAPAPMVSKPTPAPIQALASGLAMQVKFPATASKLPAEAQGGLKGIAAKLKGRDDFRLQLLAYAGGDSLSSSKARRLSLSRALSVRSFLIESGVHSTRIDVRALGNKSPEGPINRVDVNIAER